MNFMFLVESTFPNATMRNEFIQNLSKYPGMSIIIFGCMFVSTATSIQWDRCGHEN